MGFDLRYNLQHIGDIVVGAMQKTADSALSCSRGVLLTYDIQLLKYEKMKVYREIRERISLVTKEETADITGDSIVAGHVSRINAIEKKLTEYQALRSSLIHPLSSS